MLTFDTRIFRAISRISLALLDLVAGELAAGHRVQALDARGHVAIGNALHFKLVQIAVIGNLAERQRGVFNQPNGGRFRHQRGIGHNFFAPSEPSGVP